MKASIQMQFNWIFVLIAGAVILAAFFAFIQKQRYNSQQKIADTLIKDIETLATVAGTGKGAEPIQTPRIKMGFVCDVDCSCNIEVGRWTRSFREKIIFSPEYIEGTSMVLWGMPWHVPFRATNFLFITNRNVKYFFIYSDDSFSRNIYQKFREVIPAGLDFEFSKIDLFISENDDYEKTKFVFLGVDPGPLDLFIHESFKKADVSAVILDQGSVTFFEKTSSKSLSFDEISFPYVGRASLFAATFAEKPIQYKCNMQKAFKKLSNAANLLEIRAEVLDQEFVGSPLACGYLDAVSDFATYKTVAQEAAFDLLNLGSFPAGGLEQKNNALLIEGCPLIY